MKKYLRLLPLILYPYAYIIYFILLFTINDISEKIANLLTSGFVVLIIGYTVLTLITAISSTVLAVKGKYSAYETAKMNLAVKAWHIPAYIFHLIMFGVGMIASIWGIGFIMIAVIVDLLTIALSGINAVSCAVKLKKEGIISKGTTILFGIGSFIYCLDLLVAIIYVFQSRKHR
ncbi:MAG: hypothetical protein E7497_04770 [Ruminococcus sp.]|nr:hypothetical protein [Ruminococcus sp.]